MARLRAHPSLKTDMEHQNKPIVERTSGAGSQGEKRSRLIQLRWSLLRASAGAGQLTNKPVRRAAPTMASGARARNYADCAHLRQENGCLARDLRSAAGFGAPDTMIMTTTTTTLMMMMMMMSVRSCRVGRNSSICSKFNAKRLAAHFRRRGFKKLACKQSNEQQHGSRAARDAHNKRVHSRVAHFRRGS